MLKKANKRLSLAFTLLLFASITCSSGAAVIAETTTEHITEESHLIKSPEESLPESPPVLDVPETMNEDTETNETAESQETQEISDETEMWVEEVEGTQETIEITDQVEKSEKDALRTAPQNTDTGDFTVKGGKLDTDYTYADNSLTFVNSGKYRVSGTTTVDRIVIAAENITLTLDGVNIDVSGNNFQAALLIKGNSTATIDLIGENVLSSGIGCAGLQNDNQANDSLVITSEKRDIEGYAGSLTATGSFGGAGIGGGNGKNGTVSIAGGSIIASGSAGGAGIGGGNDGIGTITISTGKIIATGIGTGSGIGGGNGESGTVTIAGGDIEAIGGKSGGSGIGGGSSGNGTVIINAGSINATGYVGGSGIGAGSGFTTGTEITINGGKITATGGPSGAGIGGGNVGSGMITITGGTVTATGGKTSSGIGRGQNGDGGEVTISGGSVKALNDGKLDSIDPRPVNGEESVELCDLIPSAIDAKVSVDETDYKVDGPHENDDKYYLYLTKESHKITVISGGQSKNYFVSWESEAKKFVLCDLVVNSGADVTYNDNKITLVQDDASYEVSMREEGTTTTKDQIKVTGENITINLNGVKIDFSEKYGFAALMIEQGASATIKLIGENELKSGDGCAGLQNNNNTSGSLVIDSDTGPYQGYAGSLEAIGGDRGAGIGGRQYEASAIEILGGEITATGNLQASGIGGGSNNTGTVTIDGGVITATGAADGAGIGGGGGAARKSGTVTINGGTITAIAGSSGSDIGRGDMETYGKVTINGGNVKTGSNNINPAPVNSSEKEVVLCDLIPVASNAKVFVDSVDHKVETPHEGAEKYYLYLTKEKHTVTVTTNGQQKVYSVIWNEQANKFILWESELMVDNFTDVSYSNNELILAGDDETYNVSMSNPSATTTKDRIRVTGSNVTVRLNDVKIDFSNKSQQAAMLINSGASATVDLVGENQLKSGNQCAGLQNDNTLKGSLIINSGEGDFQGYAGSLDAQGGTVGAGIGGGNSHSSVIEIHGGLITATGKNFASGIGGGNPDSGSGIGNVTITGGAITANGSHYGAAIGGGYKSEGIVSISGGTITAYGGDYAPGIGNGNSYEGSEGKVTITGGSVKASARQTPISPAPTSYGATPLGLYQADASSYTDGSTLTVGTTDWKVNGKHTDDDQFYFYLPEEKHVVTVADNESFIEWKEDKFVSAATYTLTIPKTVALKDEGNTEQVKLMNNFYGVPGYNKQVTASLTANGMTDNKLILKNQGDNQKQAHSLITYTGLNLPSNSAEKEAQLKLGKPIGTAGNDPLQAGTYKGTLIFEAERSAEGVTP